MKVRQNSFQLMCNQDFTDNSLRIKTLKKFVAKVLIPIDRGEGGTPKGIRTHRQNAPLLLSKSGGVF